MNISILFKHLQQTKFGDGILLVKHISGKGLFISRQDVQSILSHEENHYS